MLKSTNGGYLWDVLNGYRSNNALGELNDLYFSSTTTGIFVGASGVVLRTTDGGSTFTLISYTGKLASDEIVSVSGTGANVYMAVSRSSVYHRHSVIYNSSNTGSSWTLGTSYRTMDLRDVQYMSNGKVQAGGNYGHFVERLKAGTIFYWWQKPTNSGKNFRQFYFINDNEGIAIIDSVSGYGQIYKTTDRGDNWELISAPGDYYNSFYPYKTSDTTHKLIAVGRELLVHRIILGSGLPFGIIPMSNPPSTANNNFRACWAVEQTNGETWIFIGNDNGNIYFTDQGSSSLQTWTSKGTLANGVRKIMFKNYVSGSTITLAGTIANNTASSDAFPIFFDASKVLTIGTFSPAPISSATFNDFELDTANNRIYMLDETNTRIYLSPINSSSISSTATLLNNVNPNATPLAMSYNQADTLFAVHSAGAITMGVINNAVNPPTIAWTQDVNNNRMPVVNDIQYSSAAATYFVCGDGGFVGQLVSGVWRRLMVNVTDNFNAIKTTSSTTGYLAADNGKIYTYTIASSIVTCTEVSTTVTANLNDILINGNAVLAVGDQGTILFTSNITTTPLNKLTFNSNADMHGVALRPGTIPAYTTVGDNSTLNLSFGGLILQQKNIALPNVRNVSFTDANNGFVLADRFNIRQTSDGGETWTPVKPGATIGTSYPVLNRILATAPGKAIVVGNARWAANIANLTTTQISTSSFGGSALTHLMDVATNGNVTFVAAENGSNGQLWQKTGTGAWGQASSSGAPLTGFPLRKVHMFRNGNILLVGTNGKICYYNDVNNVTTNWTAPTGLTTNTWLNIFFHDDLNGYEVGANGAVLKTSNITLNGSGYHVFGSWVRMETDDDLNSQTDSTQMTISAIGFSNRTNGFIGGTYTGSPEGYYRRINDLDGRYSTRFWYDKLGRIVISQNSKQYTPENKRYSYTRYDELGRVFEAGELTDTVTLASGTSFRDIFGATIANYYNPDVINDDSLNAFIANNLRREVTRSYYDSTWLANLPTGFEQTHLRKRIAHVSYENEYDGNDSTYDHATNYSYDIHGNVKTLVQDNKKLADSTSIENQRFKKLEYNYDLISGNVHQVSYQKDSVDAFHHKYEYDADNRITEVYTSTHQDPNPEATSLWENDAKYFYYAHGPLARTEIGDLKVQGMDYVYTLQGWIKGVNSSTLDSLRDPGLDGWVDNSNVNKYIPKDVMGYNLNYYTGDYEAINTAKAGTASPFASITGSDLEAERYDLYNGNIGSMITTITNPTSREVLPLGNAYQYDQLNRIKQARSFTNLDFANNEWESGSSYAGMYENTFTYDANGNILGQLRKDHVGSIIDSLTYRYARNTNNHIIRNRLYHVNDNTNYNGNDIDNMGAFDGDLADINTNNNYGYTEIGELKFDKQEGISEIAWTVSGKVKYIYRSDTSSKKELGFDYDAMGQRIAKHVYSSSGVWEKSTYYVRDASGNVMSVYDHVVIDSLSEISLKLKEHHIYGSSRLGMRTDTLEMIGAIADTSYSTRTLGKKQYEMSNHLGNVLSVVSDKYIPVDDDTDGTTDRYLAEILSAMDYSPFGVVLEGREFSSSAYRYTFQNQEHDDELKGEGNSINFTYRMHDPRLGRFFAVDPLALEYPYNSTYAFSENSIIAFVEFEGMEAKVAIYVINNKKDVDDKSAISFRKRLKYYSGKKFKTSEVSSGKNLLSTLQQNGNISLLITIGHSNEYGIYGDDLSGLYRDERDDLTASGRSIGDLQRKIKSGDIKFTDNAVWILSGCNGAGGASFDKESIASQITLTTGVTTIAATGTTGSKYDDNGNLILTTDGEWFKTDIVYTVTGTINDQIVNEKFSTKREADDYIKKHSSIPTVIAVGLKITQTTEITNLGSEINPLDYTK